MFEVTAAQIFFAELNELDPATRRQRNSLPQLRASPALISSELRAIGDVAEKQGEKLSVVSFQLPVPSSQFQVLGYQLSVLSSRLFVLRLSEGSTVPVLKTGN